MAVRGHAGIVSGERDMNPGPGFAVMLDATTSGLTLSMAASPKSLTGLVPFLKPYRLALGFAALFLLLAAGTTLAFPGCCVS